jgi:AcrR family transcriptional regulator
MARRHSADALLEAATSVVAEQGLAGVTFGRVASAAGTNDRTVVYYFPTKDALLKAIVERHVGELHGLLAEAFADAPLPSVELARRAWPALTTPAADGLFATFFELAGLAAAGREPFAAIAGPVTEGLVAWVASLLDAPDPTSAAHALVAQLDGALLLRHLVGPDAGDRAAAALGWC